MLTVSFIVATHNRGAVMIDCLRRTLAAARDGGLAAGQFSVVVVDNASTDGTPRLLLKFATEEENVRVIRLGKNEGPVAKNHGMKGNPADIYVLMDDDAYPLPGALAQMLRHFAEDVRLGAAVFDVMLPDGSKEASAYPDVFIGAGTALRRAAVDGEKEILPADFFMQAEEYDLSFRLIADGWSVQRFWDMPWMHLKAPGRGIGERTTRLDVRNNMFLLARYLREPVCHHLAADWMARYRWMAMRRDEVDTNEGEQGTHQQAFSLGASEGLERWNEQRRRGKILPAEAEERIFKWAEIRERMKRTVEQMELRRVAFADLGKNMLAFYEAARDVGVEVVAVVDDELGAQETGRDGGRNYRGLPLVTRAGFEAAGLRDRVDALVLTTMSGVHRERRAAAWRRVLGGGMGGIPVVDLFSRRPMTPHEHAVLSGRVR